MYFLDFFVLGSNNTTPQIHLSCILIWFKGVGCIYEGGMAVQGVWSILYIYKEIICTTKRSLLLCAHPRGGKLSRLQVSVIGTLNVREISLHSKLRKLSIGKLYVCRYWLHMT